MAADLRLVMNAAQRNAHAFAVCGSGNAHGYAGFPRPRGADKAQKPALDLGGKPPHGKVLEHTLLDLIEAKMLFVKNLSRFGNVHRLFGVLAPRQLKADIQVIAQYSRLGRAERLLCEAVKLLVELILYLISRVELLYFEPVGLGILRVLPKLLLDSLYLFPQVIFPLGSVHAGLSRLAYLFFDTEDIYLLGKITVQLLKPAAGIEVFKQALPLLQSKAHIVCNMTCDLGRAGVGQNREYLLRRNVGI